MRITRVYHPGIYIVGKELSLSTTASQHIGVVLRMQVGEDIILFSGENVEATAIILAVNRKNIYVRVNEVRVISRESPLAIHLVQGISKGDRMDLTVQKAAELGVYSITPIVSAHCSVKLNSEQRSKKVLQWQLMATAACAQSGRNRIPLIHQVSTFAEQIENDLHAHSILLDPGASGDFKQVTCENTNISLWVGPEGGFHPLEIQAAITARYSLVKLGPRVLRTETAAIAAISVLQVLQGDL